MNDSTFPILNLCSAEFSARVSTNGAQLLDASWRGKPLLWLSPLSELRLGKSARGGVPICFPWFGRHPAGLPNHGFARGSNWELDEQSPSHAVFSLSDSEQTRALWPHRFKATLGIRLTDDLRFTFGVSNLDSEPFDFTYALHSYFAVRDSRECALHGLDGLLRTEAGFADVLQQGAVTMPDTIDAVFENAAGLLTLEEQGRTIEIDAPLMKSCIVWNPGPGADGTHDIAEHWSSFVCVERGNIRGDAITLAPGASHHATMVLRVR